MWVIYSDGTETYFEEIKDIEKPHDVKILYSGQDSLEGIENFTNLEILNCRGNNLTSLKGVENLVNLKKFNCSLNELTSLEVIENLKNLEILNCHENYLTSLKGIENLSKLKNLTCFQNFLSSLEGIENLSKLEKLTCFINNITSLKGIENLVNLREFRCFGNKITSLEGIENLVNLKILDCCHNRLTSIKGVENLRNLKTLYCSGNEITSINEIIFLPLLENVDYDKDKVILSPVLRRRLLRNNLRNIYNDPQNVHNSQIQKSLRESIIKLMQTDIQYDLNECTERMGITQDLENYIRLFEEEYNGILFREILEYVFNRILLHENKNEMIQILKQELRAGDDKCFVGKITRVVNVLSGFDPDVNITISENEQKNNIAQRIFRESKTDEEYKEKFEKEMKERGFTDYEEWMEL